ncbi:MAG: hypothetical protein MJ252_30130, partial [archaeon]|nr:hypothetical protein [archaeon]
MNIDHYVLEPREDDKQNFKKLISSYHMECKKGLLIQTFLNKLSKEIGDISIPYAFTEQRNETNLNYDQAKEMMEKISLKFNSQIRMNPSLNQKYKILNCDLLSSLISNVLLKLFCDYGNYELKINGLKYLSELIKEQNSDTYPYFLKNDFLGIIKRNTENIIFNFPNFSSEFMILPFYLDFISTVIERLPSFYQLDSYEYFNVSNLLKGCFNLIKGNFAQLDKKVLSTFYEKILYLSKLIFNQEDKEQSQSKRKHILNLMENISDFILMGSSDEGTKKPKIIQNALDILKEAPADKCFFKNELLCLLSSKVIQANQIDDILLSALNCSTKLIDNYYEFKEEASDSSRKMMTDFFNAEFLLKIKEIIKESLKKSGNNINSKTFEESINLLENIFCLSECQLECIVDLMENVILNDTQNDKSLLSELLYFIKDCGTQQNGNEDLFSMIIDFIDSTYENANQEFKLKLINDFEIHKKFGEFFFLFKT